MQGEKTILNERLDYIRNKAIDDTILATTILTLANYILNLFRDAEMIAGIGAGFALVSHLMIRGGFALLICGGLYMFRHRAHYKWKYLLLVVAGAEVFLYSIHSYGLLALGKPLMIFVTLLIAFAFQFRLAVAALIAMTLTYLFTDWMFITRQWEFSSPAGIERFILNPFTWVAQGFLVCGITLTLMRMGTMQKRVIMESLQELEEVNHKLREEENELRALRNNLEISVQEKTEQLQRANAELTTTYRTLTERNGAYTLAQEELEQILKEYEDKQASLMDSGKLAAIGMLTAGMAHEINNPLNFIMGATHLLEAETSSSPQQKAYGESIHRIREAVSRTSRLISGLNQFNRRTDRMDEVCDIADVAGNIIFIINPGDSETGIKFNTHFPEERSRITGNSGKLHQAMLHLFEQAIRDRKPGSAVDLKLAKSESQIRLTISCELADSQDPTHAKPSGIRRQEALGAYITNRILKEHRAELLVSQSDNGRKTWETVFTIS